MVHVAEHDLEQVLLRIGPCARALRLPGQGAEADIVPCARIIEPEFLRSSIHQLADHLKTDRLVAAASLWSKYYDAAAMTGVLGAVTLEGVGFNAAVQRTGMLMKDGFPMALCLADVSDVVQLPARCSLGRIPPIGRSVSSAVELQQFVWRGLFAEHLLPFVETMAEVAQIRPRILWSNIGSRCAYYFERFSEQPRTKTFSEEDRAALLGRRQACWTPGRNPLYEPVRYASAETPKGLCRLPVRKTCCLRDQLPDAKMCGNCPRLSLQDRIDRHLAESRA